MFSFFKKKRSMPVPEWASFFTPEEYNRFITELENYFKALNIRVSIHDGVVEDLDGLISIGQMGLSNLTQGCKQSDPNTWSAQIAGHFEGLRRSSQFAKEFEKRIADFDYVKDFIGVRLFNTGVLQGETEDMFIRKDLLNDAFIMLCFDFPDSLVNIKPDQAALWEGRTNDELFAIGLENIRGKYTIELSEQKVGEADLWVAVGDHFFVPNILFHLDQYPQLKSPYGMLIGVPTRHMTLIYPIHDLGVIQAVTAMTHVISGMYQDGPGSLSEGLHWYIDGQFENLPFTVDNGNIQFRPTEHFLDILNQLQAPQESEII
jgi:hypothetical protein